MIKIYIVTYKCPFLNDNLKSLFESDAYPEDYSVDVIVNHPDYYIADEYRDRVTIHLQSLRSETSEGFLSRDWNQALVLGFGNLRNPEADQVILCQDDTIWHKNWRQRLDEIHEQYSFYACGWGDGFMSFKPEAVRRIGLFDESYVGIGYHEGDYFLRQLLYNTYHCSINDRYHHRTWNPTEDVVSRIDAGILQTHRKKGPAMVTRPKNVNYFVKKWECYDKDDIWWREISCYWNKHIFTIGLNAVSFPRKKQDILYPQFERQLYRDTLNKFYNIS